MNQATLRSGGHGLPDFFYQHDRDYCKNSSHLYEGGSSAIRRTLNAVVTTYSVVAPAQTVACLLTACWIGGYVSTLMRIQSSAS